MWYAKLLSAPHRNSLNQSLKSDEALVAMGLPRLSGQPRGAKPMKITFGRNTPPPREVPDTPKFAGDKTTLIKLMATTKRPTFVNAYTAPMFSTVAERGGASIILWHGEAATTVASEAYCTCVSTRSFQNRSPAVLSRPPVPHYPLASSLRPRIRTMV